MTARCQVSSCSVLRDLGACGADEFGVGVRVPAQAPSALGRPGQQHPGPVGQGRGRRRQLDDVGELADARELLVSSPKLRGSFPAGKTGGIATPAAQQASAKCSSAADTPAAASRRKMATRHDHEGTPEMNARPNIVLVHGAWADGSSWSAVIERLRPTAGEAVPATS